MKKGQDAQYNNYYSDSELSDEEPEHIPPNEPLPPQPTKPIQIPKIEEPDDEITNKKSIKEIQQQKRELILKIKNYSENFKEHITSIIGFSPKENLEYFKRIKTYTVEELETELSEFRFQVAN